jgi:hypothetical protein
MWEYIRKLFNCYYENFITGYAHSVIEMILWAVTLQQVKAGNYIFVTDVEKNMHTGNLGPNNLFCLDLATICFDEDYIVKLLLCNFLHSCIIFCLASQLIINLTTLYSEHLKKLLFPFIPA